MGKRNKQKARDAKITREFFKLPPSRTDEAQPTNGTTETPSAKMGNGKSQVATRKTKVVSNGQTPSKVINTSGTASSIPPTKSENGATIPVDAAEYSSSSKSGASANARNTEMSPSQPNTSFEHLPLKKTADTTKDIIPTWQFDQIVKELIEQGLEQNLRDIPSTSDPTVHFSASLRSQLSGEEMLRTYSTITKTAPKSLILSPAAFEEAVDTLSQALDMLASHADSLGFKIPATGSLMPPKATSANATFAQSWVSGFPDIESAGMRGLPVPNAHRYKPGSAWARKRNALELWKFPASMNELEKTPCSCPEDCQWQCMKCTFLEVNGYQLVREPLDPTSAKEEKPATDERSVTQDSTGKLQAKQEVNSAEEDSFNFEDRVRKNPAGVCLFQFSVHMSPLTNH
jgi:hypothetical protein